MITCRLHVHVRAMKAAFGATQSAPSFQKVLEICVESCALMVICGIVLLASTLQSNFQVVIDAPGKTVFFALMTHICVITPLLLVVRVANGRAHSPPIALFAPEGAEVQNTSARRHRSIRFARPTATSATQLSSPSIDMSR
ncbi:hypothetical protein BJ912DRAFT_1101234 [Pholiota molesta]|nr:hypothetical protein BJ912DRAFT_1101234 [Pholiota molesta]